MTTLCSVLLLSAAFSSSFFFFNDTPPTEIYTLSLHDALPICGAEQPRDRLDRGRGGRRRGRARVGVVDRRDRKSTRLNSSHRCISYAVFCLKKKKKKKTKEQKITDQ